MSKEISATAVKDLREKTGAGMMDCKKALTECQGDFAKAVEFLRKKGIASAEKKAGRLAKEGAIYSYIHGEGRIGVMVEINCETDFVARTEPFKNFVKDIAMHIAAANPTWLSTVDIPAGVLEKEAEIAKAQMQHVDPSKLEKIVENKVKKFTQENSLLTQFFVKDTSKTIDQFLKETIATVGENVSIRRFTRYVLGEGLSG